MGRRKKGNKIDGWINLDKPAGLTSTQAIGKLRRYYSPQKIGHAGTLDPLATGVLPIAMGEATKTIPYMQDGLKTYSFTIAWGQHRDTLDSEGEIMERSDVRPSAQDIEAALPAFIGEIEQIPPQFSAIKVDGQRAYDLARQGEDFELKARLVYIEQLKMVDSDNDSARFSMVCGKGTYVRSIARDLAEKLGTLGHISALRREAVGPFSSEDAISFDILEDLSDSADLNEVLLPIESALDDIPALKITRKEASLLRNGQALGFVSRSDFSRLEKIGIEDKKTENPVVSCRDDKIVALAEIDGPYVKPVRVFNT